MNGWFITVLLILLLVAGLIALYQRIRIALLRSKLEDAIHTNAQTNTYLNMSLFLAFALLYPDYQILLFFILPVKMKYIALADAALMTYSFIIGTWPMRGCMILSLLPLFLFFGDTMLAEGKRIVRQIRYKLGK